MYAVIRESIVQPEAQARYDAASAEFAAILAQQPGYCGSLVVNAGNGRSVRVLLRESEATNMASRLVMPAHEERLLQPHLTGPSTLVGREPVVAADRIIR